MAIDKILFNGRFYTENPEMPWADAVAISGKKIAYAGDNEGAMALAETGTELLDLEGKTVIPVLLDGHTHPAIGSKTFWYVRGPLTEDKDELLANIAEYVKKYPCEGDIGIFEAIKKKPAGNPSLQ